MMYSDVVMLNEQHVFIHRRDTRFVPTTNTCFLLYYIFFFIQYNILYKEEQNIRERNRENYLIHQNICIRILSRVCVCVWFERIRRFFTSFPFHRGGHHQVLQGTTTATRAYSIFSYPIIMIICKRIIIIVVRASDMLCGRYIMMCACVSYCVVGPE